MSRRHREPSPITFDRSQLAPSRSRSRSPLDASSTDGEVSDSEDDTKPVLKSSIVPVTKTSTVTAAHRNNSVEPPSPSHSERFVTFSHGSYIHSVVNFLSLCNKQDMGIFQFVGFRRIFNIICQCQIIGKSKRRE